MSDEVSGRLPRDALMNRKRPPVFRSDIDGQAKRRRTIGLLFEFINSARKQHRPFRKQPGDRQTLIYNRSWSASILLPYSHATLLLRQRAVCPCPAQTWPESRAPCDDATDGLAVVEATIISSRSPCCKQYGGGCIWVILSFFLPPDGFLVTAALRRTM